MMIQHQIHTETHAHHGMMIMKVQGLVVAVVTMMTMTLTLQSSAVFAKVTVIQNHMT
jgi:hypothetical protein